ncbi:UNVERIFIED_CONTAM: hypothetical protein K2H54_060973 [Gekko kuhli]
MIRQSLDDKGHSQCHTCTCCFMSPLVTFLLPMLLAADVGLGGGLTFVWTVNPLCACNGIALVDLGILVEIGQLADPELLARGWGMKPAPHCLLAVCLQQAVIPCLVAQLQLAGGW